MTAHVLLSDPKHAHNVGGVLRACSVLGAERLVWTGKRVPLPEHWPRKGMRLPREERLSTYRNVPMAHCSSDVGAIKMAVNLGLTPVAVEKRWMAESLLDFDHPEDALYVFGPEDGSLARGLLTGCHRFVRIPAAEGMENVPLNLAAAVNITLYDRMAKALLRAYV
jgi:tRNA(Leu) C34 or U34 (ribose-2'-O)-methylase TrmL